MPQNAMKDQIAIIKLVLPLINVLSMMILAAKLIAQILSIVQDLVLFQELPVLTQLVKISILRKNALTQTQHIAFTQLLALIPLVVPALRVALQLTHQPLHYPGLISSFANMTLPQVNVSMRPSLISLKQHAMHLIHVIPIIGLAQLVNNALPLVLELEKKAMVIFYQ